MTRKGYKQTKEHRRKLSEFNRGENNPMFGKIPWNKGKTFSKIHRKKLSESLKGRTLSKEHIKNISIGCMRCRTDGYCDAWSDPEYKTDMRKAACEDCGITNHLHFHIYGMKLSLHHINGNKKDCRPVNLKTLCISCHSNADRKIV